MMVFKVGRLRVGRLFSFNELPKWTYRGPGEAYEAPTRHEREPVTLLIVVRRAANLNTTKKKH